MLSPATVVASSLIISDMMYKDEHGLNFVKTRTTLDTGLQTLF